MTDDHDRGAPTTLSPTRPTRRLPGQRVGLTDAQILDVAIELLDEGAPVLTLAEIARRLDVQLPSLYSHVAGLSELKRLVRLRVAHDLISVLHDAAANRRGRDGLQAVLGASRQYALTHVGRWLTIISVQIDSDDPEFQAATDYSRASLLGVLRSFGLPEADLSYWDVLLWSWTYGYVNFEITNAGVEFTDHRFQRMVGDLADMLERRAVAALLD